MQHSKNGPTPSQPYGFLLLMLQALYALARSDDEAVMAAGTKALHNVLLRAQHLDLDHIFSRTVSRPALAISRLCSAKKSRCGRFPLQLLIA